MNKIYLFLTIIASSAIFAQNNAVKRGVDTNGFDEERAIQELKSKGLDPAEFLDAARREYKMTRAKELGLLKQVPGLKKQSEMKIDIVQQASSSCANSDFAQLDFTNWTGGIWALPNAQTNTWTLTPTWTVGTYGILNDFLDHGGAGSAPASIPTPNRHAILSTLPTNNDPSLGPVVGYDSIAISPTTNLADIPLQPSGSAYSLRLGNANVGSNLTLEAETEQIIYTLPVTSTASQFTFQYAVVLNNPFSGHATTEQPFFEVIAKDQAGNQISGPCAYFVTTDLAGDTSYHFIHQTGNLYNGYLDIFYKNWTTVTIPLGAYIGTQVTIEFRTADCTRTGHFGYAYITASCNPLAVAVNGCTGTVTMDAPLGFASYQWFDANNVAITGADSSRHVANNVSVNDTFYVNVASALGCSSTLTVVIQPCGTSISSQAENSSMKIYPNPSNGNFVVSSSELIDEIKITDVLGQVVYTVRDGSKRTDIQIENAGVYFAHIKLGTEIVIKKIVVDR